MTKVVKLGEVCSKILSGGTPSTEKSDFWNGNIPWITSADVQGHFTVTPRKFLTEKAGADILPAGNVLVVTRVGLGKVAVNDQPLAFSQDLQGLILKPVIDSKFLVYGLSEKLQKFKVISRGATIKGVTRDDLVNIEIPLPPLPEQRRIAALLDRADALRQKDRQLLAHYDALAQSVFLDMFGEEGRWPTVNIEAISNGKGSMRTGPFGSDLLHSEFVEKGVFVLGINNVVNNRFEWAKSRFITEEKYEKLKRYTVYPGDVLISIMGTTGRTAVVPDDMPAAINSKHLVAITLNKHTAVPMYLTYSFLYDPDVRYQLKSQNKGAIMDGLNLGVIKALKIKQPPLSL
ncbi:restriction endonuclease subunit S [Tellurirhabdus rosea]|uniref:restriction endonuclease subunit S n=1 Tax=Tellurirhabdus rosea TaxID=2674997 RepID=UPI002250B315|nr:restriction endonuclease subunit S [Tellurirhabdus rosea]